MKKNIVIIIGSLELGGTESHLLQILPLLLSRGWKVQVITFVKKGILANQLEEKGIKVETAVPTILTKTVEKWPRVVMRPLLAFFTVIGLIKKMKAKEVAIWHFFLPEAYVLGSIAARIAGLKQGLVMSRRSQNHYQKKYWKMRSIEARCHQKTALLLGNSLNILAELEAEGVSRNKMKLIYNGVNLTPFSQVKSRETVRQSLNISSDSLVFIKVANLIPYKGHQDLLDALATINDQLPNPWHLICVGREDNLGQTLREYSARLKLSNHISWLGSRRDVADLMMASDIGILCSHEEGFSNAILEGMAASLPMVVTDVGGNREAVIHEETGLIVPAKNPIQLAQALMRLAKDPNKARTFGNQARIRVEQKFSLKTCVDSYHEVYQNLIEQKG